MKFLHYCLMKNLEKKYCCLNKWNKQINLNRKVNNLQKKQNTMKLKDRITPKAIGWDRNVSIGKNRAEIRTFPQTERHWSGNTDSKQTIKGDRLAIFAVFVIGIVLHHPVVSTAPGPCKYLLPLAFGDFLVNTRVLVCLWEENAKGQI